MELLKDNQMVVTNEKGEEKTVTILFTYENEERKKSYVFFVDPDNDEEVIVMSYTDDGNLEDITDEEEYDEVEEVYNAYQDDPKIQELK